MDYGIEGRVALVAASSKGLGKACAMEAAKSVGQLQICVGDGIRPACPAW